MISLYSSPFRSLPSFLSHRCLLLELFSGWFLSSGCASHFVTTAIKCKFADVRLCVRSFSRLPLQTCKAFHGAALANLGSPQIDAIPDTLFKLTCNLKEICTSPLQVNIST